MTATAPAPQPTDEKASSTLKKPTLDDQLKTGWIDLTRQRWVYLGISLLFLVPGIFFMGKNIVETPYHSPVKLGIDFVGGTLLEYGTEQPLTQKSVVEVRQLLEAEGYPGSFVQLRQAEESLKSLQEEGAKTPNVSSGQDVTPSSAESTDETTTPEETGSAPPASDDVESIESILSIRTKPLSQNAVDSLRAKLTEQVGSLTLLQKYAIGPTLASELLKNAVLALGLAYLLIFGYVTYRFQWDYAVSAMVALVHDSLFVFGLFAALGYFFGTEVDSLFVTALLTVVGFSVHDTIVTFDRLRENTRLLHTKKLPFPQIANLSVQQTLARSINTSLTCILSLGALYFLGGTTIKDFILTMMVGIAVGTYSSIFIASLVLTWMRQKQTV